MESLEYQRRQLFPKPICPCLSSKTWNHWNITDGNCLETQSVPAWAAIHGITGISKTTIVSKTNLSLPEQQNMESLEYHRRQLFRNPICPCLSSNTWNHWNIKDDNCFQTQSIPAWAAIHGITGLSRRQLFPNSVLAWAASLWDHSNIKDDNFFQAQSVPALTASLWDPRGQVR